MKTTIINYAKKQRIGAARFYVAVKWAKRNSCGHKMDTVAAKFRYAVICGFRNQKPDRVINKRKQKSWEAKMKTTINYAEKQRIGAARFYIAVKWAKRNSCGHKMDTVAAKFYYATLCGFRN